MHVLVHLHVQCGHGAEAEEAFSKGLCPAPAPGPSHAPPASAAQLTQELNQEVSKYKQSSKQPDLWACADWACGRGRAGLQQRAVPSPPGAPHAGAGTDEAGVRGPLAGHPGAHQGSGSAAQP